MSKLEELIKEYCPDGVEYKSLSDLFEQFSGMAGVSNKWADDGNCRFIDYLNAYNNLKIDTTKKPFATVKKISQKELKQGDILFTSASETPDECALSSVIEDEIEEGIFLDDHLFGIRVKDGHLEQINTTFYNYYFHCGEFRKKVYKVVRGVTRHYISVKDFMKLQIPVPPLEVQREIVRILDKYSAVVAEMKDRLADELTARKKQYEHYRNLVCSLEEVPYVELRSVVKGKCSGATPKKSDKRYYENGSVPWIRTQDVNFNEIQKVDSFITETAIKETAAKWIPENCVIIAISGASAGRCAVNKIRAATNQHCLNLEVDETKALYQFVYYCVCCKYEELLARKQGARGDLNSALILGITIPLPPLEEQARIVKRINAFNVFVNDIQKGLPAEIEARQKQYEYYRDKLLSFKEKEQ